MTTTGVMPVLGTGLTVESPVLVCWTPVSVMIAPVLRLSGRDTASTPGKVYLSDIMDIFQHIRGMAGSTTARGRMLRPGLVTASRVWRDISQTGDNNTVKYSIELVELTIVTRSS